MEARGIENALCEREDSLLEIVTLGRFVIRHGQVLVTEQAKRSNKLWDLFKFLLTHRDKQFRPESIAGALWPDEEPVDPRAALQSAIHRMRRLFAAHGDHTPFDLEFSQGAYQFSLQWGCWLDVDVFTHLSKQAFALTKEDPLTAMSTYSQAIELYQGVYLPEQSHKVWLLPSRHYYRRIFVKNVSDLVELQIKHHQYPQAEKLCEQVFLIDPLLEAQGIHLGFMKALAEQGKVGDALAHYEFIASILQQETGAQPAVGLRDFYRLIRGEGAAFEPELSMVREKLREREEQTGAFFCDRNFFRLLYLNYLC